MFTSCFDGPDGLEYKAVLDNKNDILTAYLDVMQLSFDHSHSVLIYVQYEAMSNFVLCLHLVVRSNS